MSSKASWPTGRSYSPPGDEDIHTAVERRVTELAGAAGAKLHTGRSRNDQVATDLRLYAKRELSMIAERVLVLQQTLLRLARAAGDQYLPGYTHLQRAQPVLLAHHFLAHGWALSRTSIGCSMRAGDSMSRPWARALAGSSLPLDPDFTAQELGFASRFENSLDAVSDRDFVAEGLFALTLLAVHFVAHRRRVRPVVERRVRLRATRRRVQHREFDAAAEEESRHRRAGAGQGGPAHRQPHGSAGDAQGVASAYNRDLQEDKEPFFDAVDQIALGLSAITGMLASSTYRGDRMTAAADSPYAAAVDLAEFLVAKGMPFRDAHAVVGALVRQSIDEGDDLVGLVQRHEALGADAAALLAPGVAVTRRTTPGGAGPHAIGHQLERFAARLVSDGERLEG